MNSDKIYVSKSNGAIYQGKNGGVDFSRILQNIDLDDYESLAKKAPYTWLFRAGMNLPFFEKEMVLIYL